MGKRRFIWSDRDAHQQLGNDVDVRGTNNQERRKGASGLCDADFVYPDDMLVEVRDFSAVMVVMGDFVVAMAVRREVTMGDRRVIGRVRFVHMLPGHHGRQGKPWHQRRDNQDSARRSHRAIDYMPQGTIARHTDQNFRLARRRLQLG